MDENLRRLFGWALAALVGFAFGFGWGQKNAEPAYHSLSCDEVALMWRLVNQRNIVIHDLDYAYQACLEHHQFIR